MSDKTFKDPVRLEVTNLLEGRTFLTSDTYERGEILRWIEYQRGEMGAKYHSWRVVEIEG